MSGPYVDPLRYVGHKVGAFADRPEVQECPERFLYFAVDTFAVWGVSSGAWVKIADLTAGIAWDEILNKPESFVPSTHDIEDYHTGYLAIERVYGHDFGAQGHRQLAIGLLTEPL
jgi:hypothetical protein